MNSLPSRMLLDTFSVLGIDVIGMAKELNLHFKFKFINEKIRLPKIKNELKEQYLNKHKIELVEESRKKVFNRVNYFSDYGFGKYHFNSVAESIKETKNGYMLEITFRKELQDIEIMDRRIRPYINKAMESLSYNSEEQTFSFIFLEKEFKYKVNFQSDVLHVLLSKNYVCLFNFILFNIPNLIQTD